MSLPGEHTEKVSVIIPCRNEEAYIGKVLDNVLAQDYPPSHLEVFIVDGESEDSTKTIIDRYVQVHPHFHFLSNPQKVVPYGLNKAIRKASGSIIVRMDAHSEYPNDYISLLVKGLATFNCDNTGGVWITEPANGSHKAVAIADATSHPFGIGNAQYRLDVKSPKKVDTVPYGCYRKEVFDRIGLFDEDLVRNQDDEFNARLINHGGSIYLLPDVKIRYFARDRFRKVSKMFYQYGLFKPLVNLKVGKPATLRQFAPPLFTLFIMVFGVSGFWQPYSWLILGTGLAVYALTDVVVSLLLTIRKSRAAAVFISLLLVFPIIHLSYGLGYLEGIIRFILFRKHMDHQKVKINR